MSTFDAARWLAVSPYLSEALDLTDGERTAFLESLAARHPAIAQDVVTLLADHQVLEHDRFLERTAAAWRGSAVAIGQRVGAYTLTAPIGQGGMGTVWLAERSDGAFARRAAIKFLSVALAGRGEERFRREGRILGRLAHPHIAQLLDAGVAAWGQPYLVLEYIDGQPIDVYCEQQACVIETRIAMVRDILSALSHAHANLVVHRDLKPSNVLVGRDGKVTLLDFGIAKLLEQEQANPLATWNTHDGGHALTPRFAAPEQIRGEPVTTTTDVYAVGILIYLVLTGRHPIPAAAQSPADLVKAIVETTPVRMSEVVENEALRRRLRGDLDTIVQKAMKKAPADRYGSVAALDEDLRRYQGHEPIGARPDSVAYRTGKLIRRHRMACGVAVAILAMLVSGLLAINRQRTIAERRFVQVRQLASRLLDLDVLVRDLAGASKARQTIVDTALEYLERVSADAGGDPQLQLEMATAYLRVARVQGVPITLNLGQAEMAEATLLKAQAAITSVLAKQPANRTAILRAAQIAHDRMVLAGDRRADDAAMAFAGTAVDRLEQYLAPGVERIPEPDQVVIAYMNVANRYMNANRIDDAIRMTLRTIDVARATNQNAQAGAASIVLARAYRERGDLDRALAASREAVHVLEPPAGEVPFGRTMSFGLALSLEGAILGEVDGLSFGREAEALPVLERAWEVRERLARRDSREAGSRFGLVTTGRTLGGILRDRDPVRALAIYDRVLTALHEIPNNSRARRNEATVLAESAYPLRRLGRAAAARGRLDAAFRTLQDLKLYPADRIALGSEADDVVRASAQLDIAAGNAERSLQTYRQLLDCVLASKPEPETRLSDAFDLSRLYSAVAAVELQLGHAAAADELISRRMRLWQQWARTSPDNAFVHRQLAASTSPAVP
jgi:tetratricopeptide (TPR) repeat protein